MLNQDPLELDREVRRAASNLRRARRALRDDPKAEFVLSASLRSEELLQNLEEAPDFDPLARPLLRWLYRLNEEHELWRERVELVNAWQVAEHPLETPLSGRHTRKSMLISALADPERRADFLEAFFANAEEMSSHMLRFWEARSEFASRFRVTGPAESELVRAPATLAAENWLRQTQDLFDSELRSPTLSDYLERVMVRENVTGWPAKITPQSLKDLLSDLDLFRGLSVDPGRLPRTLGVSSFLRAFARIGSAIVDAAASPRQPFVIAHDPYGLKRRELGALLGCLPLNLAFARRRLNLGSERAQDHARLVASLLLLESRALALRVLLRGPALESKRSLQALFPELTETALGFALPVQASLTVFRLHTDDAARFSGLLLAAEHNERFVQVHDEDWFRNPRAAEELRADAESVPAIATTPEALARGANELLKSIRAAGL